MYPINHLVTESVSRLRPYLRPTPFVYAYALSSHLQADIYVKLEILQPTGSFKVRGAFNKLLSLTAAQKSQGVIAASTGNHGAAVAYAAKQLGVPCEIVVPVTASTTKIAAIKAQGVHAILWGNEGGEAENYARTRAQQENKVYVSPYNDLDVIAGQGTMAYEMLQQLPTINMILGAVGGGGLMAGVAGYSKSVQPRIETIGCLPENSPVMAASVKAGKIVTCELKPTLSDATAGSIEANAITFSLCQEFIDAYILVSESEIQSAMQLLLEKMHLVVEGAGAVTVAVLFKHAALIKHKQVGVILSGANISLTEIKKLIA